MTTRTWTREQTEDVLNKLGRGGAPWYADVLDAYEDLIAVCELALEASGATEHVEKCEGLSDTPDGCHYYAEHEAVRLLNILRDRNED